MTKNLTFLQYIQMTRSLKSQQPYQYHHLNMSQTPNTKWTFFLTVKHRSAWLGLPTSTNSGLAPINLYHLRRLLLLLLGINLNPMDGYQSSSIAPHTTTQPIYICDKVDRIYFSRQGYLETKIISPSFPYPMPETISPEITASSTSQTPPTWPLHLP